MVQQYHHRNRQRHRPDQEAVGERKEKRPKFFINDNVDILVEILKRLDGRSLGVASCVCRLWCTIARNDSLWEDLCFRHESPPPSSVRSVVVALGGYKRLYMACVRPVLNRLERVRRASWTRDDQVQLLLSLFCVDCYERLGAVAGTNSTNGSIVVESSPSSLMFLCNPVNV